MIKKYLELVRFSHTLFAMPFAMWSAVMAWLAPGPGGQSPPFRWLHLLGIVLCMVFARSAAMAFNRWADRELDRHNPRTSGRHLPAGLMTTRSVLVFAAAMSTGFVLSTLLFLPNRWPLYLAPPILAFLLGYSYAKRFTSLAHFWLGMSLMLTPLAAWIALRGQWLSEHPGDLAPAVWLGAAVLCWVAGFDIIYACQDYEYDRRAKLRSVPVALGVRGALRLAAACHLGMLACLAALPLANPQLGLGPLYWLGVSVVAILLLVEHWLVRPDDLSRVNLAFFHVNAVVSIGLFVVGSLDMLI